MTRFIPRGPISEAARQAMVRGQELRRNRERLKATTGIDPMCLDLAEHFLRDHRAPTDHLVTELAAAFQQRCEEFFAEISGETK